MHDCTEHEHEAVEVSEMKVVVKDLTTLVDCDGRPIRVGDLVEFYYCADHNRFTPTKVCCNSAHRLDYVTNAQNKNDPKDTRWAFANTDGYAWGHEIAPNCKVVGSLPQDAEKLVDAMPMAMTGDQRARAITKIKALPFREPETNKELMN